MLFTAAVETPTASATSLAFQLSTSRRISTARCRGERCCSATMNANRVLSRSSTTAPGSVPGSPSTVSGSGSNHGISGRSTSASPGSQLEPSPEGSGRRFRFCSALRHAVVAIRCSQVRSDERPSNLSKARQARR
jgi:hypothetical protein